MKAITVEPKKAGTAKYMDMPEPDINEGSVLVEAIAVGYAAPMWRLWKGNMAGRLTVNNT